MNKGILYFSAPWCEPCKTLSPQMNNIEKSGIPVKKVNIDYDAEFPKKYNVETIPTCILTDMSGKEIKRHVGGFDGITAIKNWFNG
tara:strand:- start:764 stop:1021 length:258 start_codon:yes stop_codon:yes gene_type:complete